MTSSRRPRGVPLILLGVAALVLSACDPGSGGTAAGGGASEPAASIRSTTAAPSATMTSSAHPSSAASPSHPARAATVATTAAPAPSVGRTPPTPQPSVGRIPPPAPTTTRYVFPVRCSNVSYAHTHHDYPADDIFAATGCVVVSPVSGVVEYVTTVDTWNPATNYGYARGGLSFAVVGSDGVRYYGSHLSVLLPGIRVGVHVTAGQQVGNVGRTGDAAQPGISSHLHFGISWPTPPTGATGGYWWVRRGEVWPWPYLDAWRAGIQKSPAAEVAARRASVGATPSCSVDC